MTRSSEAGLGEATTELDRVLATEMERWEASGLRRRLVDVPVGERRVDFVSNDTLGLSRHPAVIEAARAALGEGAGSRASRLLGGGSFHHAAAERAAADWTGAQAGLLFPSGYQANLGVVSALVGRGDAVLSDERNHASLVDAARLSRASVHVHRHLDLEELERLLISTRSARRRLVLTEGVFSMDGDAPRLERTAEICARHRAWLVVDEAHAIGLVGPEGAGAWAAAVSLYGVDSGPLAARILTGGKALGVAGAVVVGSRALREHLLNHAKSFVFTTAPPPATAAALEAAIGLARSAEEERTRIRSITETLARNIGRPAPSAAILPYPTGTTESALELARKLAAAGLDVRAVRPPTVPLEASGLRIVLHAFNTDAECDELGRILKSRPPSLGAPAIAKTRNRPLFVVGTDTGVGKTVVSALLLRAARQRGPTAYWKPVQTGTDLDTESVERLADAQPHELLRPAWTLPLPASPHAAAEEAGKSIRLNRLRSSLAGLQRTLPEACLIVELAGGLLVPYATQPELQTQADWLARDGGRIVLVARSGLGTLNHTLLTLEALRSRHLEPRALFLVGAPHASNRATLAEIAGVSVIFELEELAGLDANPAGALDAWLERNDLDAVFPFEA